MDKLLPIRYGLCVQYRFALILCVLAIILGGTVTLAPTVQAQTAARVLDCKENTALESLIDCISKQMPQHGSNGYKPPTQQQKSDLQSVALQMLNGSCDFALPSGISNIMSIRTFQDQSNNRAYCLFMEVAASTTLEGYVANGWGTFITYAQASRAISHHAPHPKFDLSTTGSHGDAYTERQAVRIFKLSDARSYLMAGARRSANTTYSTCQTSSFNSDVAHDINNMFFAVNQTLNAYYGSGDWTAYQWHGKAADSCDNDMYLSEGLSTAPASGAKVERLLDQIKVAAPDWKTEITGSSRCSLNGTTNVEGRLLNGVAAGSVCGTAASASAQKFIHIEQTSSKVGENIDGAASKWANAINAMHSGSAALLPAPANLAAIAGDTQVQLSWTAVDKAVSYNVKRSTASAGPFTTIASVSGGAATSFTDAGLNNGMRYYYVTTALDSVAAESANSNTASAMPLAAGSLSAPTGVSASAGGERKINLKWNNVSGATSYTIKWSTDTLTWHLIPGVTNTNFAHRNLASKQTYYYMINAVNGNATSPDSNMVHATVR